jgi:hypothetical protein
MEGMNFNNIVEQVPIEPVEDTQEKINKDSEREIAKSLQRLMSGIQDFEEALRLNNFKFQSFNTDEFRSSMQDESLDLSKTVEAIEAFSDIIRKLNGSGDGEQISTDPHRFIQVIDSLDSLKGLLISMRSKVDKSPVSEDKRVDSRRLFEALTKAVNASRRKLDDLSEAQNALRRYSGR